MQFFISYWKILRNLSSLLNNLTYLSLLNSFLLLSRFSVSLKSLDNYFFSWFAYKSLLSRFPVSISYNMWSYNQFSISSCVPCFSGFGSRIHCPGPGFRSSPILEASNSFVGAWEGLYKSKKSFIIVYIPNIYFY